jgi:hypothetical protein
VLTAERVASPPGARVSAAGAELGLVGAAHAANTLATDGAQVLIGAGGAIREPGGDALACGGSQ